MALTQRMAGSEPFARELIDQSQPFMGSSQASDYEIAGLQPLPWDRMLQRAVRLQVEAGGAARRLTDALTGKGSSRTQRLRGRAETIDRVRSDWDPLRSHDKELENRFRGLEGRGRSKPANPEVEAERLVNYGNNEMFGEGKLNSDGYFIQGGAGFPLSTKEKVFQQYDRIMERDGITSPLQSNIVPTLRTTGFGEGNGEYRDRWNMQFDPPKARESRRKRLAEMESELRGSRNQGLPTGAGGAYTQGGNWLDSDRLEAGQRGRLRSGNISPAPLIVPGVGHQFEGI